MFHVPFLRIFGWMLFLHAGVRLCKRRLCKHERRESVCESVCVLCVSAQSLHHVCVLLLQNRRRGVGGGYIWLQLETAIYGDWQAQMMEIQQVDKTQSQLLQGNQGFASTYCKISWISRVWLTAEGLNESIVPQNTKKTGNFVNATGLLMTKVIWSTSKHIPYGIFGVQPTIHNHFFSAWC